MSSPAHKFAKEVEQVALEAQNQNACKIKFGSIEELCGSSDFIVVPSPRISLTSALMPRENRGNTKYFGKFNG